jgi:hypothetical protein
MSGRQRDQHTALAVSLGKKLQEQGIDVTEDVTTQQLLAKGVQGEVKEFFSKVQYMLIAMSVMDGNKLPEQCPLWTEDEVGDELSASMVDELAAACEQINSLAKKQEEKAESDFTTTQS